MFLLRVTTAARGIGVESGGAEHKYRASLSPPTRNTPNHLSRLEVFDAIPLPLSLPPRGGAGPYTARAVFSLACLHLSVGLNGAPRDIRNTRHAHTHTKPGRANTTAYRRRRRRRAPKHRWPCSPPGQPRGAVGGWAPASNLPAPCWPHRDKGTKISNCKSVVMVFTVSVGFAMDGILGVSESRKRCVCNGRRPIPNFFAQDDEVLHSQKAR